MALDVYHAFLPSLGRIESEELLPCDGSPIFEKLLELECFASLSDSFLPPAVGAEPIDLPVAALETPGVPDVAERTIVLDAVTDNSGEDQPYTPWLPNGVGSWRRVVDAA